MEIFTITSKIIHVENFRDTFITESQPIFNPPSDWAS